VVAGVKTKVGEILRLELVLPVPTSINALYINQFSYNPKTKKREMTGARILSKAGQKRKDEIAFHAKQQMENQEWDYEWTKENFVYQDAVIHFARRGSDDNNIYKLLNDTLEGIAYDNDSRVLVRTQRIVYDSNNPRVEVTLTPVDFVGVFENQEEADQFELRCNECTRFLNGRCSILVDSLNGTVREEIGSINEPVCVKYKVNNKL
jgi:Holliday junction resolvase RusA-like endonuclease